MQELVYTAGYWEAQTNQPSQSGVLETVARAQQTPENELFQLEAEQKLVHQRHIAVIFWQVVNQVQIASNHRPSIALK